MWATLGADVVVVVELDELGRQVFAGRAVPIMAFTAYYGSCA